MKLFILIIFICGSTRADLSRFERVTSKGFEYEKDYWYYFDDNFTSKQDDVLKSTLQATQNDYAVTQTPSTNSGYANTATGRPTPAFFAGNTPGYFTNYPQSLEFGEVNATIPDASSVSAGQINSGQRYTQTPRRVSIRWQQFDTPKVTSDHQTINPSTTKSVAPSRSSGLQFDGVNYTVNVADTLPPSPHGNDNHRDQDSFDYQRTQFRRPTPPTSNVDHSHSTMQLGVRQPSPNRYSWQQRQKAYKPQLQIKPQQNSHSYKNHIPSSVRPISVPNTYGANGYTGRHSYTNRPSIANPYSDNINHDKFIPSTSGYTSHPIGQNKYGSNTHRGQFSPPPNRGGYGGGGYISAPSPGGYAGTGVSRKPVIDLTRCFLRFPNTLLANVIPFERTYDVTIHQCLSRCLNSFKEIRKNCNNVVYVPRFSTCDLFENGIRDPSSRAILLTGYDYFMNTGLCGDTIGPQGTTSRLPLSTTRSTNTHSPTVWKTTTPLGSRTTPSTTATTTTAPQGSTCKPGEDALIQRASGYKLRGSDGYLVVGTTEQQCADGCRINTAPDRTAYPCVTFDFDTSTGNCIFSVEAALPLRFGILQKDANSVYGEKTCLPVELASKCGGIPLDRATQGVLEADSGGEVRTVSTMKECLILCLSNSASCRSIMYFYEEQEFNCLLNIDSRRTRPNSFKDFEFRPVEYVGLDTCLSSIRLRPETSHKFTKSPNVNDTYWRTMYTYTIRKFTGSKIQVNTETKKPNGGSPWAIESLENEIFAPVTTPAPSTATFSFFTFSRRRPVQSTRNHSGIIQELTSLPTTTEFTTSTSQQFTPTKTMATFGLRNRTKIIINDQSSEWLNWGRCDRRIDGRRIRYRKCGPLIQHCRFQVQWCNRSGILDSDPILDSNTDQMEKPILSVKIDDDSTFQIFSKTNGKPFPALDKVDGRPSCLSYKGSCQIGIRMFADGTRKFCLKPKSKHCS